MLKKLLAVVMALCLFLTGCAFYLFYGYTDSQRLHDIDRTPYNIDFYLKDTTVAPRQALVAFQKAADDYGVSIEKVTSDFDDNVQGQVYSGIFTAATYPIDQLGITQGFFPQASSQFLATYRSNDQNQTGSLYDFAGDDRIKVESLQAYYDRTGRVAGTYRIVSTEPFDNVSAMNDIAAAFNESSEALLQKTTFGVTLMSVYFPLIVGAAVLVLLVFALLMASMPVLRMKAIGVQKLLGWSNLEIWVSSLRSMPLVAAASVAATDIALLAIAREYSPGFVVELLAAQMAVFVVLILVTSLSLLVIRSYKADSILKQSVSAAAPRTLAFVLKAAFAVFLAAFAVFIGPNITIVAKDYQGQQQWMEYGSYQVMSSATTTGEDLDSIASGDARMQDKYAQLYPMLSDQFGGIYASSSDYPLTGPGGSPVPGSYQTMTVNPNYLKEFPLKDEQGNDIRVDESDDKRVVLVPQSRAGEAASIGQQELKKIQSLNDSFLQHAGDGKGKRVYEVQAIVYQDDHSLFSFSDKVAANTGYLLTSPVVDVVTDANISRVEAGNLSIAGVDSPLKFKLDAAGLARLQQQVDQGSLADSDLKFDTLENTMADEIAQAQNALSALLTLYAVVFAVNLVASFFLFSVVVLANRKLLYVEKLQGLSLAYRFRSVFVVFGAFYAVGLVAVLLFTQGNLWAASLMLSIAVLDALVSILIVRFLETRNTTLQLKEG